MDINSHIDWRPGMPLKAKTFQGLYRNIDTREKLLLKLYSEGALMGVLPNTELAVEGVFVKNSFEIDRLRITALLRDGNVIDVDETMCFNIPMLSGEVYYLSIAPSEENIAFEREDVRYLRPKYAYELLSFDDLQSSGNMPIAKFRIDNNQFHIDNSYILPYLLIGSCQKLLEYHNEITEKLEVVSQHPNLVNPDAKRTLLQQVFDLKTLSEESKTATLMKGLQEIALAIDYFVMRSNGQALELLKPEILDLRPYMDWMLQFLDKAKGILDSLIIEDDKIDYEKLKEEIKSEIYERINPELYHRLISDLQDKLRSELKETLTETLTDYFERVVKPQLCDQVSTEVTQVLQDKLYTSLYDALYQALYIPPEEEENFMPMI